MKINHWRLLEEQIKEQLWAGTTKVSPLGKSASRQVLLAWHIWGSYKTFPNFLGINDYWLGQPQGHRNCSSCLLCLLNIFRQSPRTQNWHNATVKSMQSHATAHPQASLPAYDERPWLPWFRDFFTLSLKQLGKPGLGQRRSHTRISARSGEGRM